MRERFPKLGHTFYLHPYLSFFFGIYFHYETSGSVCSIFYTSGAVKHLDYLGVQVAWITGPWFLSIFVNMLPWESGWFLLLFFSRLLFIFY